MTLLTADDQRHGTLGGYSNHGCKCDLCHQAMREYMREYRFTHKRTSNSKPETSFDELLDGFGEWLAKVKPVLETVVVLHSTDSVSVVHMNLGQTS